MPRIEWKSFGGEYGCLGVSALGSTSERLRQGFRFRVIALLGPGSMDAQNSLFDAPINVRAAFLLET